MIPNKTHPTWRHLLLSNTEYCFSSSGLSRCISRQRQVAQRNACLDALDNAIHEVYLFCKQYESMLTEDIKQVFH